MTISDKTWKKYIKRLERIDKAAAEKMAHYLDTHPWFESAAGQQAAIEYAHAVTTRYGEAAAEAACLFYDEIADGYVRGMIPAAEPAPTPHYKEVERAVDATGKLGNKNAVSQAVGRLVKRTGADTTLQNAIRDGAEWAWIPSGDTCAFCLTLASRGWQKASRQTLKNGHAEHIHANCDCAYMVRFNGNTQVEGYNPDKYLQMYNAAEGHSAKEKVNALRRMQYAKRKDVINAQKRAAAAERRLKQNETNDRMGNVKPEDITQSYKDNATPGQGNIKHETGYNQSDDKDLQPFAEWLYSEFGGDIVLKENINKDHIKSADYLWNGKLWDLKTTTTEQAANSAIKSGLKQIRENPGGVFLNYGNTKISEERLIEVINKRMQWCRLQQVDIMIKHGDGITVLRYKK